MPQDRYTEQDKQTYLEIVELARAIRAEEEEAARSRRRIGFRPNDES